MPANAALDAALGLTASDLLQARATQVRAATAGMGWAYAWNTGAALLAGASIGMRLPQGAEAVWAWIALTLALQVPGAWAAYRLHWRPFDDRQTVARGRRLGLHALLAGATWGALPWLVLPTEVSLVAWILLIGLCLVLITGAGLLAIYRPYLLGFTAGLAGPAIVGLALLAGLQPALAIVVVGAAAVSMGLSQERAVRRAIVLNLEKERLLQERARQQQATEDARRAAEAATLEARRADASKTAFLAAVSHDLRQPMHAMVQYHAHLAHANRDRALADSIDRVGQSLGAMQDLLDRSLEISRLLMGAVTPVVTRFPLAPVLARIDAQMRPMVADKHLDLRFGVPSSCVLHTDSVLLERILRNLVLNALRYTEQGAVQVRVARKGAAWRISVVDSGQGIPAFERDRIFEAFYQIDNAARDRRKGLGLGLAIVRQLSDLLGAQVRLRSRPGRGSCFSLDLPAAEQADAPDEASHLPGPGDFVAGSSIVVIDDDPESLAATATTLRRFGCHVTCAASSGGALERLHGGDGPPHLVLSDYRLQGEDGVQAIAAVIAHQRAAWGDEFPIAAMVMSGDTTPAERDRVREAGHVLLAKPVAPHRLHAALNHELRRLAHPGQDPPAAETG